MMAEDLKDTKFASYDELRSFVSDYQTDNKIQLYVRDSRTIAAAQKRLPKRQLNASLQYYQITYCCIHGGRQYKSHGSGIRPNQQYAYVFYCQELSLLYIGLLYHLRLVGSAGIVCLVV